MSSIRFWRRSVQIGVALAFIAIPVLNRLEINHLVGNFLSFNFAGLPLSDPLASLQVAAGTLSATQAMLVGAGLALLLAVLMGPVFCAWSCPFGLLSELVHSGKANAGRDTKQPLPVTVRTFAGKAALVGLGLLGVILFVPVPVLNQLSMPGWYSRIMQHAVLYRDVFWGAILLMIAILAAERFTNKRFWCAYVCPQSVLISLAGLVFPKRFQVRFTRKSCTCAASDRACLKSCSLGLNPRVPGQAQSLRCTNCGDCIDACRSKGRALNFGCGKEG